MSSSSVPATRSSRIHFTDLDSPARSFLLHALQLSYLRHVLPNHASLSATTSSTSMAVGGGTAAYNLVDFAPPHDLVANNPYIALSGAADPQRWPELGSRPPSGRRSPPLAPLLAREAAPRRGERGGGGLQYSQTIGKGVASAGMKVEGGRSRTWKGRGRLSRAGDDVDGTRCAFTPSRSLSLAL